MATNFGDELVPWDLMRVAPPAPTSAADLLRVSPHYNVTMTNAQHETFVRPHVKE